MAGDGPSHDTGQVVVVPAILPERWEDVAHIAQELAGTAPRIQIDVVDGMCGREITWPFVNSAHWNELQEEREGLPRWQDVDYEIDLMVRSAVLPEVARGWVRAGACALIFHPACSGGDVALVEDLAREVKESGVEVGIAVRPREDVKPYEPLFARAAFVQIMGNDIVGAHGLALMLQEVCAQLQRVREMFEGPIGIDIGVNAHTLPQLAACGFVRFAVGSAIVKAHHPRKAYRELLTQALDVFSEGKAAPPASND